MRTLWWVMGASAVGKKTLIREALVNAAVRTSLGLPDRIEAAWMGHGAVSAEDVAAVAQSAAPDTLLRWQFGREALLPELRGLRHVLLLVVAEPGVHYARMLAREGERWSQHGLVDEAEAVRELAFGIAAAHGLPLRVVEASSEYRVHEVVSA